MQLGMVGLGRMGANLVARIMAAGHECVVYDRDPQTVAASVEAGAVGAESLADLAGRLDAPRAVWVMVPAAITGKVIDDVAEHLEATTWSSTGATATTATTSTARSSCTAPGSIISTSGPAVGCSAGNGASA